MLRIISRRIFSASKSIERRRIWTVRSDDRSIQLFRFTNMLQYHATTSAWKKAGKNGKGKGKESSSMEEEVELPDVKRYDKSMENTVNWYSGELNKLKLGRIPPEFFSDLPVDSYGTVGKAGQVTLKSSSKLVVAVYDPAIASSVADALKKCGLGLNPQIEGSNVSANIPKPSKEARDLMIKNAGKMAEKVKNDIRNVRKNAHDEFKRLKNKISDDDIKRLTKEVDQYATDRTNKIDQLLKEKEKEINSIGDD